MLLEGAWQERRGQGGGLIPKCTLCDSTCHTYQTTLEPCKLASWNGKSWNCNIEGTFIWVKVFKNGPGEICGRQSLKNLLWSILEYFIPYENKFYLFNDGGPCHIETSPLICSEMSWKS